MNRTALLAAVAAFVLTGCGNPDPVDPGAPDPVWYANCDDARDAGAAPLRADDPGYSKRLDRDGDGVACD